MIPETIEHWDDLEVTVIFTQDTDYAINFSAVEIVATHIEEGSFRADRGWTRKGGTSNMDLVYDPREAEKYLSGFVKWDGCSHLYFGDGDGYVHLCGPEGIKRMSDLLPKIFNRCGELLGDKVLEGVFGGTA